MTAATATIRGKWVITANTDERAEQLHKTFSRVGGFTVNSAPGKGRPFFAVTGDLLTAQTLLSVSDGIMSDEPKHGVG